MNGLIKHTGIALAAIINTVGSVFGICRTVAGCYNVRR